MNSSVDSPSQKKTTTLIKRKRRWPYPLIWAIPLASAICAGLYLKDYSETHGPELTISFPDASGLRAGESKIIYRGADVATVKSIELSPDHKQALVRVQLDKTNAIFATKGAKFWIVRPEISETGFTGLGTIFSGPYIAATLGDGAENIERIEGLTKAPREEITGTTYRLTATTMGHVSEGSAVTYKGIAVGSVQKVGLDDGADHLNIEIIVFTKYAPLVRRNSKFWIASGFDVEAGLFSGVKMKLDSLKTLATGGIAFATPEEEMGGRAKAGSVFAISTEVEDEWETWSPRIYLGSRPAALAKKVILPMKEKQSE